MSTATARVGVDREATRPFESFGEQLAAIIDAGTPLGSVDPRLYHHNRIYGAATGGSQGDPASGGFVVAPSFAEEIWDGLNADTDNLLNFVDTYPVVGESMSLNANAETSRANGSRWGGVESYWINEADQLPSSLPKFRDVKVEPQELAVLVYLTNKLLRHAPATLEQYVRRTAVRECGFKATDAIIRGTGAGTPLGLLNSGSLVTVAKESGQAAATIEQPNISKMWARLHPNARKTAVWLYNPNCEEQLDSLWVEVPNNAGSDTVGGVSALIHNQTLRTLKGRPMIAHEACSTLGTEGDLILWSPPSYVAGVRQDVDSQLSMHIRFNHAESALRVIFEVDGQPWLAEAIAPFKGSDELSTHVSLATRA